MNEDKQPRRLQRFYEMIASWRNFGAKGSRPRKARIGNKRGRKKAMTYRNRTRRSITKRLQAQRRAKGRNIITGR